jgi:hypothetical protein
MRTVFTPAAEIHHIIEEATFDDHYPLLANHLDPERGWATDDGQGRLFETCGEELAFVQAQEPRCIWTLVDGDNHLSLLSGYHSVNRVGYLISLVPVAPGVSLEVLLPEQSHISLEQE